MANKLLNMDTINPKSSNSIIKFSNLSIYNEIQTNKPILNSLNFEVEKSEKVAILSDPLTPISALFDFLLQFNFKSDGTAFVNSQPIESIELNSLRKQIFYMSKKIPIFNTTLKKNIHPAFPNTIKSELYIRTLEILQKFNFENPKLTELGLKLNLKTNSVSPDDRTAVGMARLFTEKKKICLLDRIDARFDNSGIEIFADFLKTELKESAILMICEQATTVLEAFDRVVVFEEGEVVEDGRVAELVRKKGSRFLERVEKEREIFG